MKKDYIYILSGDKNNRYKLFEDNQNLISKINSSLHQYNCLFQNEMVIELNSFEEAISETIKEIEDLKKTILKQKEETIKKSILLKLDEEELSEKIKEIDKKYKKENIDD